MEKNFNYILKNFTIIMGGKHAGFFALGVTLSIILVFICQLIYSIVKNKKSGYSYTKFALFCTSCSLLISICEYFTSGKIFTSIYFSVIFTVFNFLISMLFSYVLSTVNYFIDKKTKHLIIQQNDFNDIKTQRLPVSDLTKKAIMRLKTKPYDLLNLQNVTNEFIDVQYIKELIDALKDKPLTLKECEEIEELEVFLLNFCYRQPNAVEKEKLSLYLSSLMKKLAYYKIVE